MRLILLLFFSLIHLLCQAQEHKPNIIIINIDDLGWRDVGFMGSKFYETPVIDALAKEGMIFTSAYAGASNCAPSRASLMTGLWPTRHGIYTVGSAERGKSSERKLIPVANTDTLSTDFKTLAQSLQEAGYNTCMAGKWHLSDDPTSYGFDVNIGGGHNGHPQSYYPPYGNVKLQGDNKSYLTDLIMDKTIAFVNSSSKDKSFFLYYASYAVHTPIQKVDSLLYKFEGKKPWEGQSNVDYATMLNNEDRNIGRLLEALKKKGVFENTLIIFTSDNGGLYNITFQRPLRAGKGSYFEGGIRVPLAFIWKNKIPSHSKSDVPVTNLDFYPTLLHIAGAHKVKNLDGTDLTAYLMYRKGEEALMNRPLYWYFPIYLENGNQETNDLVFRTRPGEVVRVGDWKLHHYFEDDSWQLYNLKNDIGERNNVADIYPNKVKELAELLRRWRTKTNAPKVNKLNPAYAEKKR